MSKFCRYCGAEIAENNSFCTKCGNRTDSVGTLEANNTYQNQPVMQKTVKERVKMSKGKKAKIIVILILIVVLMIAAIGTCMFFFGSAHDVYSDMQDENYTDALMDYEDVCDSFIQKSFLKIYLSDFDEEVVDKFKSGDIEYDSAYEALETLSEMGFEGAEDKIDDITVTKESDEAFEKGTQYYENGEYEDAIEEFSKIPETDENYEEAQNKLSELYTKYISSITDEVDALNKIESYEESLSLINTALEILPSSVDTTELINAKTESVEGYKTYIISKITEYINNEQFTAAISMIDYAITVDDNEDFQTTKTTVETKYVKSITDTVQKYLDDEDYLSASRIVSNALNVMPDNSDLKTLETKIENETPIYLLDVCQPYTSVNYEQYVNGETFNMGGTAFSNGFSLNGRYHDEGVAVFNISGNYQTLSFSLGHVDGTNDGDKTIKIYCDGILKTEQEIISDALPQRVTIDITGVKQLKFVINENGGESPVYGFGNVIVK